MSDMLGKVAIITGASSGIGRAISVLFAKHGALLSMVGRDKSSLEETQKLCAEHATADKLFLIPADVTKEADCERVVDLTIKQFKKLDVLVNGHGMLAFDTVENIGTQKSSSASGSGGAGTGSSGAAEGQLGRFGSYDTMMNTNVTSVIMLSHFAVSHLVATKGSIVNISSVNGQRAFPGVMSYCMSKAAIDQFTRCAALDLAPKGVRVNAVSPGVIRTELHRRAGLNEDTYQSFLERSKTTHAMGRVGQPEEVAEAVFFLASDRASFTTGVTFCVDGGRHAMCPR